jgi:hypothetical protein
VMVSETRNSVEGFFTSFSNHRGTLRKITSAGMRGRALPGRGPDRARLSPVLFILFLFLFSARLGKL